MKLAVRRRERRARALGVRDLRRCAKRGVSLYEKTSVLIDIGVEDKNEEREGHTRRGQRGRDPSERRR